MFARIDYAELRELLDGGAQLVEVLPAEEYAEEHLPGAINIPLKALDAESTAALDKQAPVIVYCWDYLCDMSPRARRRADRGPARADGGGRSHGVGGDDAGRDPAPGPPPF